MNKAGFTGFNSLNSPYVQDTMNFSQVQETKRETPTENLDNFLHPSDERTQHIARTELKTEIKTEGNSLNRINAQNNSNEWVGQFSQLTINPTFSSVRPTPINHSLMVTKLIEKFLENPSASKAEQKGLSNKIALSVARDPNCIKAILKFKDKFTGNPNLYVAVFSGIVNKKNIEKINDLILQDFQVLMDFNSIVSLANELIEYRDESTLEDDACLIQYNINETIYHKILLPNEELLDRYNIGLATSLSTMLPCLSHDAIYKQRLKEFYEICLSFDPTNRYVNTAYAREFGKRFESQINQSRL